MTPTCKERRATGKAMRNKCARIAHGTWKPHLDGKGHARRAGYEYEGRKFFAAKLWAPTTAGPFLAAHLKRLQDFPLRQWADTLSMKKAIDGAIKKLESPGAATNGFQNRR